MAGEAKWTYGSPVTLEASGGSAGAGVMVAADDASMNSANHSNYPLADFTLYAAFSGNVGLVTVDLYRADQEIDSTNDALDPTASTYEQVYVGSFALKSGTSAAAYYPLVNVPLSAYCKFWVKNGSAVNLTAGWTLKATPKTLVPGT